MAFAEKQASFQGNSSLPSAESCKWLTIHVRRKDLGLRCIFRLKFRARWLASWNLRRAKCSEIPHPQKQGNGRKKFSRLTSDHLSKRDSRSGTRFTKNNKDSGNFLTSPCYFVATVWFPIIISENRRASLTGFNRNPLGDFFTP